jgi:hypothetical protein
VDTSCSPTQDTKCGWCASSSGGYNIDFVKKCLLLKSGERNGLDSDAEGIRAFLEEDRQMEIARMRHAQQDQHHQLWRTQDSEDLKGEIIFKPSYHDYHSSLNAQRKRIYILLGVAGVLVLTTAIFGLCFIRHYCCDRRIRANQQRLYVQLSDQDHQIINDCARKLENKKVPGDLVEEYWEDDPLQITENPLDSLLFHKTNASHQKQTVLS